VSNDATWCQQLVTLEPRFESVNVGLNGYGVDQAYLRYLRDGGSLDHNLHLFAFIHDDFERMRTKKFFGVFDKPVLELKGSELMTENVPVPRSPDLLRKIKMALAYFSRNLASAQLLHAVSRRLGWTSGDEIEKSETFEDLKPVVEKVVERLKNETDQRNQILALVYLPTKKDLLSSRFDAFRQWLRKESEKRGVLWIDLVDDFRKVDHEGLWQFPSGNYTDEGNQLVAEQIHKKLILDSKISEWMGGTVHA